MLLGASGRIARGEEQKILAHVRLGARLDALVLAGFRRGYHDSARAGSDYILPIHSGTT